MNANSLSLGYQLAHDRGVWFALLLVLATVLFYCYAGARRR